MNLYEILNVDFDASSEEIKKAWKKLISIYHPDKQNTTEASEKFKSIQYAYSILSDKDKRRNYDNSFYDRPGDDIEKIVSISLKTAINGGNIPIEIDTKNQITCSVCHGSRHAPNSICIPCNICFGTGKINSRICSACSGRGDLPIISCKNCLGKGWVLDKTTILVRIPENINSDHRLRLNNLGGIGNPPGDLILIIKIVEDPKYYREGNDLVHYHDLPWYQVINGTTIELDFIDGKSYQVDVPPGVPRVWLKENNKLGGQNLVIINILFPELKTKRSVKLLEELIDEINHH